MQDQQFVPSGDPEVETGHHSSKGLGNSARDSSKKQRPAQKSVTEPLQSPTRQEIDHGAGDPATNPRRSERLNKKQTQSSSNLLQHNQASSEATQHHYSHSGYENVHRERWGPSSMPEEASTQGGSQFSPLPYSARPSSLDKLQNTTSEQMPSPQEQQPPLRAGGLEGEGPPLKAKGSEELQPLRAGAQREIIAPQAIPYDVPPEQDYGSSQSLEHAPEVRYHSTAVGPDDVPYIRGGTYPLENQPRKDIPKSSTSVQTDLQTSIVHIATADVGTQTRELQPASGATARSGPSKASNRHPEENKLVNEIDDEIEDMAAEVQEEVGTENEHEVTRVHLPFDPNLVCPMCGKEHRIGEIQKFRVHVDLCEGK